MAAKSLHLLPLLAILAIPALAAAQITNGDFENGGTGWTGTPPPGWTIDYPNTGGNPEGYAQIHSPFGNSEGTVCISQIFDCGEPGPNSECMIDFDYRSENWDANSRAGRVQVYIDGALEFQSPESDLIDWTSAMITTSCGRHEIRLCLDVDAGNNGWIGCFDNVKAECMTPVPARHSTWGRIKDLFH